jgi:alpha-D-xyloside xylohydrolase
MRLVAGRGLGLLLIVVLGVRGVCAQAVPRKTPAVVGAVKDATGVDIRLQDGLLRVLACGPNVARISFTHAQRLPALTQPFLLPKPCSSVSFDLQEGPKAFTVVMPELTVMVDRSSGAVRFEDSAGRELLHESDYPQPRKLIPVVTDGLATHRASVWFGLTPEERFYGLGQHQTGILNERNLQFELSQDNTNISIPFFLSSKGYGVLWNNASVSRWNNRFQPVLNVSSDVADAVDYFFISGPSFDQIIAGYRKLTGSAPLFPLWAYGYWQSKLAYASQDELLGVAARYRALHIPIDNIVLDEGWETILGSHKFTNKYPDPRSMVQALHDEHMRIMVSVWPVFQPGTANFDDFLKKGLFTGEGINKTPPWVAGTRLYDPFSVMGRETYWEQVKSSLYDIGVDAYWLDSSEPEDNYGEEQGPMLAGAHTALGNGSRYADLFPFMTTKSIYDGQRKATDRKRVFVLTRSAFAGMQREGAAAWSGDTATNFATLKRQIPAGLNYSMTGLPYWTTDIGGFVGGDTSDPAYQEVFVRWFQYGSFCPIFRAHGTRNNHQNELWSYGDNAQTILALYDRLRYRLSPYTYSLANRTTTEGYTPMRALAFDFREDAKVLDINDEFMYGPSLLVAPVTEAGAVSRRVYLPAGVKWYDFWTGEVTAGGQDVDRATPLAVMPLYVRAGTILPMGPESEYSDQHPDGVVELRIYPGHDGSVKLYEDDGISYDYEKGMSATIPIQWDDQAKVLTIGARNGSYPGMRATRDFSLVMVDSAHGVGEAESDAGRSVHYDGSAQVVHF